VPFGQKSYKLNQNLTIFDLVDFSPQATPKDLIFKGKTIEKTK